MIAVAALGAADPGVLWSGTGAVVGLLAGTGATLVVRRWPARRRPGLASRVAPYLHDVAPPSRLLAPAPVSSWTDGLERLLAPLMADAVRWVERVSGGSATVARRLDQLGSGRRVEEFRAEQVVWAVLGAGCGLLTGLLVAGPAGVLPTLALTGIGALTGLLGRDRLLSRQVARREERMLAEFPTVAELLALSVGAGEGAVGALERVAASCRGELSVELRRTLADARAGASLVTALEGLARRSSLPILARFADGVAIAVERGTPLGEVLRAQAQDVREASRRQLIELGGKKEISMMVPVVFLILPVSVVFGIFPGLAVLDLGR